MGTITNVMREDGSTRRYTYDGLDRLTSETAVAAGGQPLYSCGYGYDAVGNRTNKTAGATTVKYTLPSGNNRLSSWTAASGDNYAGLASVDVLGYSTENIGTNPALGQLYVSNVGQGVRHQKNK